MKQIIRIRQKNEAFVGARARVTRQCNAHILFAWRKLPLNKGPSKKRPSLP